MRATNKPIYYHRYVLRANQALNARSKRCEFEGALIRWNDGFGCIHPWEELGDAPLDDQLEALKSGRHDTRLTSQALRCCGLDGAARREGHWLFLGVRVPDSHAIYASLPEDEMRQFRYVKVKCGADVDAEARRVTKIAESLPTAKLRLDFNGVLSVEAYRNFVDTLSRKVRDCIDFVEDPVPYDADIWKQLPLRLAADEAEDKSGGGFTVRVVKPAIEPVIQWSKPVVITSYMDHPIGQVYAAYEAARYSGDTYGAGLLTHYLFEEDAFAERLGRIGAQLDPPEGTGLGFDDLLEALPWIRL